MQGRDYSNYGDAQHDEPLNLGPNIFIILWIVVILIIFVALIIIEILLKRTWMKIQEKKDIKRAF